MPFSHLSQLMCKGALSIFTYFFQHITNESNMAPTACGQKKNSSTALLLLLLLASSILVDHNCFKFHCVPSLPPIALVFGFWQLLLLVLLLVVREKVDATTLV
jgi:ABC-type Fe3+-siderophore transport system permease subunit